MGIAIQVQCLLFSIPTVLHLLSVYVLHLAKHTNLQESQRFYFINLSLSEFLICFLGIWKRISKIYGWSDEKTYIRFFQAGIATFVYYFVMIALTIDRFFEIFLNIRYHLFFTPSKTKLVSGIIWFTSVCFTVMLCVTNTINPDVPNEILTYFYFVFGIVCVAVSLFTYSYILKKIYTNKVGKVIPRESTDEAVSRAKHRKRMIQSMYLPILLMITFVIFIVIPEIIYFVYDLQKLKMSDGVSTALTTSYFLAYTLDVFMYILGSKYIRVVILRKFRCQQARDSRSKTISITQT
jgi:7 transmembrane receptor (rhodopsin family).